MQKARRHCQKAAPTACRRTVSGTVSLPCPGCFSPFPHGTGPLSVSYPIFSLAGWSRRIHTGFHVSRATQDTARLRVASCTGLSPSADELSRTFHSRPFLPQRGPTTPPAPKDADGLGWSPFARHYSGNHWLFSFPAGTKMFQFPAYAPRSRRGDRPSACRVVPFGNPRITGHVHLPAAYRSLSRPSSLVRAKASTVRPNLLSLAPAAKTAGRIYFRLYTA